MKFEKGVSGNCSGRPRLSELSLADVLRRKVNSPRTKSAIASELIKIATKGESEAARLKALQTIFDQLEGRPAAKPPAKVKAGKLEVVYTHESDQTSRAA